MPASRILLAFAVVMTAALLWCFGDFITDDALISLRYARHLASGDGLVWNPGADPVEGYSNFLHVVIGAGAVSVGLSPLGVLRAVNMAAALALPWLTLTLAKRIGAPRGGLVSALLVGMHVPIAYWAMSGLETALYAAVGTAAIVVGLSSWRWRVAGGLGLSWLACLIRPEGPMFVVAAVLAMCARGVGDGAANDTARSLRFGQCVAWCRREWAWLVVFGGAFAAYVGWRWSYFGYPLPNPVYVKASAKDPFELISEFLTQCPVLVALAVVSVVSKVRATHVALWWLVLGYVAMLYNVKASVADLHRFFLPVVPACAALAAVAIERCMSNTVWRVVPVVVVGLSIVLEVFHPQSGFLEARQRVDALMGRIDARVRVVEWVNSEVSTSHRVAVGDVGVIGYGIDHVIDDLFALNSETAAHEFKGRKAYVRSVIESEPGVVVLVSKEADTFDPKYKTDGWIRDEDFVGRYQHAGTISAPVGRYHYWLYVRGDLAIAPPVAREGQSEASVSARIEALRRAPARVGRAHK